MICRFTLITKRGRIWLEYLIPLEKRALHCCNDPNGELFVIKPQKRKRSPLDVSGIETDITMDEIIGFIREGRER